MGYESFSETEERQELACMLREKIIDEATEYANGLFAEVGSHPLSSKETRDILNVLTILASLCQWCEEYDGAFMEVLRAAPDVDRINYVVPRKNINYMLDEGNVCFPIERMVREGATAESLGFPCDEWFAYDMFINAIDMILYEQDSEQERQQGMP